MSKARKTAKKIVCVILLIVFSPFVLLYFLVRFFSKRARFNTYQKNKPSGRVLLLSTNFDDIFKMEDFELADLFKYLYFYQGYMVKKFESLEFSTCLKLKKQGKEFLVEYGLHGTKQTKKRIAFLESKMKKTKINDGILILAREPGEEDLEFAKSRGIEIVSISKLKAIFDAVTAKLVNEPEDGDKNWNKSVDEVLEEMYPNSI